MDIRNKYTIENDESPFINSINFSTEVEQTVSRLNVH